MGLTLLTERYAPQIAGVLSCWDRILLFGTLPKICCAEGMTSYLYERKIRIFDYPRFAEPFRNALRDMQSGWASEHGIGIEVLRKRNVRKEDRMKQILAERSEQPGLVASCRQWSPARPARPVCGRTTASACITASISFIDQGLGLGHVRAPTWLPRRLPVCFNGQSWMASVLRERRIDSELIDNALVEIADGLGIKRLRRRLNESAGRFCPIHREFGVACHWSVDQCEYATDIVFRRQTDLAVIYDNLTRTAIHTVNPDLTFSSGTAR